MIWLVLFVRACVLSSEATLNRSAATEVAIATMIMRQKSDIYRDLFAASVEGVEVSVNIDTRRIL